MSYYSKLKQNKYFITWILHDESDWVRNDQSRWWHVWWVYLLDNKSVSIPSWGNAHLESYGRRFDFLLLTFVLCVNCFYSWWRHRKAWFSHFFLSNVSETENIESLLEISKILGIYFYSSKLNWKIQWKCDYTCKWSINSFVSTNKSYF